MQDGLPASSTSMAPPGHAGAAPGGLRGYQGGGGSVFSSWEIFRDAEGEVPERCCRVSLGGCVPPRLHPAGLGTESPAWMPPWGTARLCLGASSPCWHLRFLAKPRVGVRAGAGTVREHIPGCARALGWGVALRGHDRPYPARSASAGDADYFPQICHFSRDPFRGFATQVIAEFSACLLNMLGPNFPAARSHVCMTCSAILL